MSNFSFAIPDVSSYQIEYYFNNDAEHQPAKIFPHHVHDKLEIYVLLEGDVSFSIESTVYKLSAGDAVIIKPNEMHNCILSTRSVHKHACFWFDCSCSFLFSDFIKHDFGKNNLISPDQKSKLRLLEIYTLLQNSTVLKDKRKIFYLSLEMLDIFRSSISDDAPTTKLPTLLANILADVDVNFSTIKSLSYFTEKYFISQSTLNRLFRIYLHTTPKQYVESKQLAYSRRLLKSGATVLSACLDSGFTDCSNYGRLFKNRFGITPNKYRND